MGLVGLVELSGASGVPDPTSTTHSTQFVRKQSRQVMTDRFFMLLLKVFKIQKLKKIVNTDFFVKN